jgi:hypothetical protein
VYLNFTGLAGESMRTGVDDALGRNLRRLAEIKATYDPENLCQYNNNILPTFTSCCQAGDSRRTMELPVVVGRWLPRVLRSRRAHLPLR